MPQVPSTGHLTGFFVGTYLVLESHFPVGRVRYPSGSCSYNQMTPLYGQVSANVDRLHCGDGTCGTCCTRILLRVNKSDQFFSVV